jgi:ribonuclease HII
MFHYELELLSKNFRYVAGIDEVGRGCLAGPLTVGCVVFDLHQVSKWLKDVKQLEKDSKWYWINDVKDSKKLSAKKREKLAKFILEHAETYNNIFIENTVIDEKGIGWAQKFGFSEVIKNCHIVPDFVLTDAFPVLTIPSAVQKNMIGGDGVSFCIAAASIVAKVARDAFMVEQHTIWPQYEFNQHKGYGTKKHIELLKLHGACMLHRKSFEPVKSLVTHNR